MHCKGCANLVRSILEEDVDGVTQAVVNLDTASVDLSYDDAVMNLSTAGRLLEESGYKLILPTE